MKNGKCKMKNTTHYSHPPQAGKLLTTLLLFSHLLIYSTTFSQSVDFNQFFVDKTLRVDYFHSGTKSTESVSLDQAYEEGPWPGSKTNLLDVMNYGEFLVRVYDVATTTMIYSRGYSTIFNEWQTTDEAEKMTRTFHETVRLPYPKKAIQLTISHRNKQMLFNEIFSMTIDPNVSREISKEKHTPDFKVTQLLKNGAPEKKVDIVILGDGYTKADMEKFRRDVKHFTDALFATQPFGKRKDDFNVWTIEVESEESGIDRPDSNVWRKTPLGTSYDVFQTPRYVLTMENRALRDIASAAPYDFIHILVNDNRYGGGGIYNLYATCFSKTDKEGMEWQMDYVYVHEFGHSFGGLGDEYYSSQVAYNDFYQKGVEPWEPNITALLNPKTMKWKNMMEAETPLPTPWEKHQYDSLGRERGKLNRLASDYYEKRKPLYDAEMKILKETKYVGKVGAFQGAGYASEGFYRPAIDCRMFTLSLIDFDPVCSAAIERMVDFYAK